MREASGAYKTLTEESKTSRCVTFSPDGESCVYRRQRTLLLVRNATKLEDLLVDVAVEESRVFDGGKHFTALEAGEIHGTRRRTHSPKHREARPKAIHGLSVSVLRVHSRAAGTGLRRLLSASVHVAQPKPASKVVLVKSSAITPGYQ